MIGALTVGAVLLLMVVGGALSHRAGRQTELALRALRRPNEPDVAFRGVIHARSSFTKAVQNYEQAVVRSTQMAPLHPSVESSEAEELDVLERRKNAKRDRLLDAQRLWESVRPADGIKSDVDLWIGSGAVWAWSFLLVGFERTVIRWDHVKDGECWVVWGARRLRFGPAIGFETQRLALTAAGASIEQLEGLSAVAMGRGGLAVRPGLSVIRFARRWSEDSSLRKAKRPVFPRSRRRRVLFVGPEPEIKLEILHQLSRRLGHDPASDTRLPLRNAQIHLLARGPSVLLGTWFARRPALHVLARSNHRAWRIRSTNEAAVVNQGASASHG